MAGLSLARGRKWLAFLVAVLVLIVLGTADFDGAVVQTVRSRCTAADTLEAPARGSKAEHSSIADRLEFCGFAPVSATGALLSTDTTSAPVPLGDVVNEIGSSCLLIYQDSRGVYWFGSFDQGAYSFDGQTVRHIDSSNGLCNDFVRGFQEDKAGNVYITTCGGIARFDGRQLTTLVPQVCQGMEGWVMQPEDLWFASFDGSKGPYRYDGQTLFRLELPRQPTEDALADEDPRASWSREVWSVYKDQQGSIWLGTGCEGLWRFNGKSLDWMYEAHHSAVPASGHFGLRSVIEDLNGDFWICNNNYRYRFDPASSGDLRLSYTRSPGIARPGVQPGDEAIYFQNSVRDSAGNIWLATFGEGVWRYDGNELENFPVQFEGNAITAFGIFIDRQGKVWLGTHEHGPYRFNGKSFEPFQP